MTDIASPCALLIRGDAHDLDALTMRCAANQRGGVIVHRSSPFDPYDIQLDWNLLQDADEGTFSILYVPHVTCLGESDVSRLRLFDELSRRGIAVLLIAKEGMLPVTLRSLMSATLVESCEAVDREFAIT